MLRFQIKDIQAIQLAEMEFEDNSIVEFVGDNSNGKSITSKIIEALVSGDILTKETRVSLIRDSCEAGMFLIQHNDEMIVCVITEEQSKSYISYYPDTHDINRYITRHFNEGGFHEIISKFGFRSYAKGSICLQLSPTFGIIPFITSSGSTNNDIVQDITVDKIADEYIKSFETITYPIFKNNVKNLKTEKDKYETVLNNIDIFDYKAYGALRTEMNEIYAATQSYEFSEVNEISVPIQADMYNISERFVEEIPIALFFNFANPTAQLDKEIEEYVTAMNGKCPTCGKLITE